MDETNGKKRVAIACQGGGSHTAFTAGALKKILDRPEYDIVALSGTSGGAICAFLAWYALLNGERHKAVEMLESFWKDISASRAGDALMNDLLIQTRRALEEGVGVPPANPYDFPYSIGSTYAQELLEKSIRSKLEESIEERVKLASSDVRLYVGAVSVLTGWFRTFRSHKEENGEAVFNDSEDDGLSIESILASAAVPTLFRAVRTGKEVYRGVSGSRPPYIDEGVYWDGLYAQNPPVRNLTELKPDEIWLLQITPEEIDREPTTAAEISDRRDELAGNLSLDQELYFIRKINDIVRRAEDGTDHAFLVVGDKRFKVIKVRRIEMTIPLHSSSKVNRNQAFLKRLIEHGEERAGRFLEIIPFQLRFETAWEESTRTGDERAVMDLFADDAVVRLIPPSAPTGYRLEYTKERLRDAIKWCLERKFYLDRSRNYRVEGEEMAFWILAVSDHFRTPVKASVRALVKDEKIERLELYPLTLETVEELVKTIERS
ncbi:MAG: patatin-like phospholipase family protein [Rubrobacteraceae bacterium]